TRFIRSLLRGLLLRLCLSRSRLRLLGLLLRSLSAIALSLFFSSSAFVGFLLDTQHTRIFRGLNCSAGRGADRRLAFFIVVVLLRLGQRILGLLHRSRSVLLGAL